MQDQGVQSTWPLVGTFLAASHETEWKETTVMERGPAL